MDHGSLFGRLRDKLMKKIYGNEYLLSAVGSMMKNDRAAHTVIFYGEKGSGRKTLADYYAASLVCTDLRDGRPCGECVECRNAFKHTHPDIIYAETSGKLGGYSVETAKSICLDAFVRPNNRSGRKVYIFRDCHKMDVRTQNTLLKIVEEPPDFTYFIFTSESKEDFLSTIISRSVCFALSPCSEDDTRAALAENGFSGRDTDEAVACFHGNIGMCIQYMNDAELRGRTALVKRLTGSIADRDEYALNREMFNVGKERDDIKTVLRMLDDVVRDAAVCSESGEARLIGCSQRDAARLAEVITPYQAVKIHGIIGKAWSAIEANVGAALVLTAMCAEITETVNR